VARVRAGAGDVVALVCVAGVAAIEFSAYLGVLP